MMIERALITVLIAGALIGALSAVAGAFEKKTAYALCDLHNQTLCIVDIPQ